MLEHITIKLKVIRAPDGDITCRTTNECCKFYRTERWGIIERCAYTEREIKRKDNERGVPELGYTMCTEGCPFVGDKE